MATSNRYYIRLLGPTGTPITTGSYRFRTYTKSGATWEPNGSISFTHDDEGFWYIATSATIFGRVEYFDDPDWVVQGEAQLLVVPGLDILDHISGGGANHAIGHITGLQTVSDQVDTNEADITTINTTLTNDVMPVIAEHETILAPDWHTSLYPFCNVAGTEYTATAVQLQFGFESSNQSIFNYSFTYQWYKNDGTPVGTAKQVSGFHDNYIIPKPELSADLWQQPVADRPKVALLEITELKATSLAGVDSEPAIIEMIQVEGYGEVPIDEFVGRAIKSDGVINKIVETFQADSYNKTVKLELVVAGKGIVQVNGNFYEAGSADIWLPIGSTTNFKAVVLSGASTVTWSDDLSGSELTKALLMDTNKKVTATFE